jgi:hypothetical protein
MTFKEFIAKHDIDFSPVVNLIDKALLSIKRVEPQIDHPLWMQSKQHLSGYEDVVQFFYNSLHSLREWVSRGAHNKKLSQTIKPLYNKILKDVSRLVAKKETHPTLQQFNVQNTFDSIQKMIQDITSSV